MCGIEADIGIVDCKTTIMPLCIFIEFTFQNKKINTKTKITIKQTIAEINHDMHFESINYYWKCVHLVRTRDCLFCDTLRLAQLTRALSTSIDARKDIFLAYVRLYYSIIDFPILIKRMRPSIYTLGWSKFTLMQYYDCFWSTYTKKCSPENSVKSRLHFAHRVYENCVY